MPLLIEQVLDTHAYGLWKIEEAPGYFESRITYRSDASHIEKKLQQLASRMVLNELHPGFSFGQVTIEQKGKPVLSDNGPRFSLSHCKGYAAAIVSESQEVGIDIEEISTRVLKIEKRFLNDGELGLLQEQGKEKRHETGTLLWSIKESVYKWWGKGNIDFANNIQILSLQNEHAGSAMVRFTPLSSPILHVNYERHGQIWLTYLCRNYFSPA